MLEEEAHRGEMERRSRLEPERIWRRSRGCGAVKGRTACRSRSGRDSSAVAVFGGGER
jgi:hypothetical protein